MVVISAIILILAVFLAIISPMVMLCAGIALTLPFILTTASLIAVVCTAKARIFWLLRTIESEIAIVSRNRALIFTVRLATASAIVMDSLDIVLTTLLGPPVVLVPVAESEKVITCVTKARILAERRVNEPDAIVMLSAEGARFFEDSRVRTPLPIVTDSVNVLAIAPG